MKLHPIRKIVLATIDDKTHLQLDCGHRKAAANNYNPEKMKHSICFDCPPLSDNWVGFGRASWGYEWTCKCGVGHYDYRLMDKEGDTTTHGCCPLGCCARDDAPWKV